jgi:superfamily II DNA/RNA helicase
MRVLDLTFCMQLRAIVIDEVNAMLTGSTEGELHTILENIPILHDRPTKTSNAFNMSAVEGGADTDERANAKGDAAKNVPGSGRRRSVVLFASATGDADNVVAFANKYLANGWGIVRAPSGTILPRTVTHAVHACPRVKTIEALKRLFNAEPIPAQALIFVNDPYRVGIVCDQLYENGIIAAPLAGESSKEDRKEVMVRLRDGRLKAVVTTELAARGLDFPELTHVINLDQATDAEHYVHRAGRCGRAGRPGLVMSFVTTDMKFILSKFAKKLKFQLHDSKFYDGKLWLRKPGRQGKRDKDV